MKRSLFTLIVAIFLLIPFRVQLGAAIAVVSGQIQTGSANDVVITFGSAWGVNNHILVAAVINSNTQTLDITGITPTETQLSFHTGSAASLRGYIFCWQGDGSDTSFTASTSGSASARVAAVEISGGSCTADGENFNETSGTTHSGIGITTTQAGSFVIGIIHATSAADFTVTGAGTSIPADGTEIGTIALGQYQITGAAGSYDTTYTSAASEDTIVLLAGVKALATAKPRSLLTLGVGR